MNKNVKVQDKSGVVLHKKVANFCIYSSPPLQIKTNNDCI